MSGAVHAADIASGNASMNILEPVQIGQVFPFSAPLGDGAIRLDGPGSPDVLYKYCWYYRTPRSDRVRLLGWVKWPDSRLISGDTATYTWLDNGDGVSGEGGRFDSTLTVRITDGGAAGQGRVTGQLRLRNLATTPTTIRFYHMVDLDLPGGSPNPGPDDTLAAITTSPLEARYTESSTANYALVDAPTATSFRIDSGFNLRNLMADTTTVDVSGSGPFSGDAAITVQWTLNFAPGEEKVLDAAIGINMPATAPACRADFNGVGGVTVQDIFDYLVAYFGNQPSADINGVGGVSVQDVFDYLALYFVGC